MKRRLYKLNLNKSSSPHSHSNNQSLFHQLPSTRHITYSNSTQFRSPSIISSLNNNNTRNHIQPITIQNQYLHINSHPILQCNFNINSNSQSQSQSKYNEIFLTNKYNYGTITINMLRENPGGFKRKRRRGRGPNNTIGKGHKGGKPRQGNRRYHRGYEGGQTPIQKITPKLKYHKYDHNMPLQSLDISRLKSFLDRGVLNKDKVITMRELKQTNCAREILNGLALINDNYLTNIGHKINIEVTFITPSAKEAIENDGGIVRLKYFERKHLHWYTNPESREILPRHRMDTLPRPRWRHMFPDYPQLPVREELQYLRKYQIHPELLPKNITDPNELKEQENKLKINNDRQPQPLLNKHTDIRDKLFKWARPN